MDLLRIDGEQAGRIVVGQRGLSELARFAAGRTVEDDVDHVLAAETLGGLVAENPLERIDDIALAAAVGADNAGNALGEVEPGAVGEALKAEQFQ